MLELIQTSHGPTRLKITPGCDGEWREESSFTLYDDGRIEVADRNPGDAVINEWAYLCGQVKA